MDNHNISCALFYRPAWGLRLAAFLTIPLHPPVEHSSVDHLKAPGSDHFHVIRRVFYGSLPFPLRQPGGTLKHRLRLGRPASGMEVQLYVDRGELMWKGSCLLKTGNIFFIWPAYFASFHGYFGSLVQPEEGWSTTHTSPKVALGF